MKRRNITKLLALSIPLSVGCSASKIMTSPSTTSGIIKPKRLTIGDTIGIVAPGSSLSNEALQRAVDNLEAAGFKVKEGKHWRGQYGYLAGSDGSRVDDLHAMFADKAVDGIWCGRGGYGCTRLLPHLDYDLIQNNPKILIGYSDITALLNAIFQRTGLIGFHGPVASSDFNTYSVKAWKNVLMNTAPQLTLENATSAEMQTLVRGKAEGILVGGNLTLLAAICGTPYEVDLSGKLVFIEDVGEKPYKIDRMLTQLLQSSGLRDAKGIALGTFNGCEADEGDRSLSLEQCFIDRLGNLDMPIAWGFSFGHISEQFTIPVGAKATLDATARELIVNEAAVV